MFTLTSVNGGYESRQAPVSQYRRWRIKVYSEGNGKGNFRTILEGYLHIMMENQSKLVSTELVLKWYLYV